LHRSSHQQASVARGSRAQAPEALALRAVRLYRERIPNSNIVFVYDAGHLIEAERPEALVNAVSDYVELREAFIVGRQTGIINP
jgi:hypothetical protein